MADEVFSFSGLSKRLEWYKAYDDLANTFWVDGKEYLDHPEWDERQRQKWRFFYRPQPTAVGRPQKKMIKERQDLIARETAVITELDQQVALNGALTVLGVALSVWLWAYFLVLPLGFLSVKLARFVPARLASNKAIERARSEISLLEGEVRELIAQIPATPSLKLIDAWRWDEIRNLEYKCLSEILNVDVTAANIGKFIKHKAITAPVHGILIDSWGLLQPSRVLGPHGPEKTGLERVCGDIGDRIATFAIGSDERPLYRLMYLQYIYLLDKNINVSAFFYDFVTRKHYGKRSETFQYNHVSNFSIREMELEEAVWAGGLNVAAAFTGTLGGKEINALSVTVAGGASFRCVLVDDAVVQGMNEWLKQQEKWLELQREAAGSESRQQIEQQIVMRRKALKQRDLTVARAALQQVREQVERSAP